MPGLSFGVPARRFMGDGSATSLRERELSNFSLRGAAHGHWGECRRQASTPPLLATCATSNRAGVGSGVGAVRRPRLAWVVCGSCRLKAAFPDRVRRPRPAWLSAHGRQVADRAGLASAGRSADAPGCGQAVGSRLARTKLDLGRGRWRGGGSERMNGNAKGLSDRKTTPGQGTRPTLQGQAKDLSDRNTCFICDNDERRCARPLRNGDWNVPRLAKMSAPWR